ncbi:MAG: hypothetical protein ACFFKA_07635 [Candidatus Thorarchaeota archaeon]
MILTLYQFDVPSLSIWVLVWAFLIIGLISLVVLVLYTRFGREISIKLSIITVIFTATFLGFAIHFLLISFGI